MGKNLLSVVIPVYNEEKQIQHSLRVIRDILSKHGIHHEFILVDDGSRDHTWECIRIISGEIPGIRAIRFSRNFGKEAALCAGLDAAGGDACLVMDADLQHPPQIIPEMFRLWREEGYEIIEGVKASRGKEGFLHRMCARAFYCTLKKLSGFDLNNASDFKLLDAKVVSTWRQMKEYHTFFRGIAAWVGFKRTSVPFTVAERTHGKSRWSKLRLFKLAVNAIVSFSSVPLHIVTGLGMVFLAGSLLLGAQTIYMKISGLAVSGFTTVILLLLITGSALMISLGVIGTYIAKIYEEVKGRPRFIVAESISCEAAGKSKMKSYGMNA
ncbi:MAG: glycosyltransferase family 2 protein [Bacillota bacterium]